MNQDIPSTEYDRGFTDAVRLFVNCLRMAAVAVEPNKRYTVTNRDTGHTFEAIAKSGDVIYANRLRSLADDIEKGFLK